VGLDARARRSRPAGFVHEAFFYEDDATFVAGITEFTRDALEHDEPVLVMVGTRKCDLLRDALGDATPAVHFTDMEQVGANPARIIPAWDDFVACHPGRAARGVGEPIWPGRRADELIESQRHESLLNVAFRDADMWLVCPYDTTQLAPDVVHEARCSHPVVSHDAVGAFERSAAFHDATTTATATLDGALPAPTAPVRQLSFAPPDLHTVRGLVRDLLAQAGVDADRGDDFVVAVNEIATNSVTYGGGRGTLRAWLEADAVVCEVGDAGRITDPMVGRVRPSRQHGGGAGMFLANEFCDLVQVRSSADGTIVRLRLQRSR
jgi:anti-sigma regulatory factor (Ser/Thr protein kinase)